MRKLEDTSVFDRISEIGALNAQSRQVHLEIAEELITLMQPAVDVVTSDDLKALGFVETPPNSDDYEMDY